MTPGSIGQNSCVLWSVRTKTSSHPESSSKGFCPTHPCFEWKAAPWPTHQSLPGITLPPLPGPRFAQQGAEVGHAGVDKDEERSMNMDADSFPAAGLISGLPQALYSPVVSAADTCCSAQVGTTLAHFDCITRFVLGREMGRTFVLSLSL